jgi:hypothetical protein
MFLRTMVIYRNWFFENLRTGSEQGWTPADNRFFDCFMFLRTVVNYTKAGSLNFWRTGREVRRDSG